MPQSPKTPPIDPGVHTLALAGVEFTLPQRGEKRVFTKGWPSYRPDQIVVARHLAGGGNLGVHLKGYTDGRVLVTFDGDDAAAMATLLAVAPELANSLRSWRASGSGKISVWVGAEDADKLAPQSTENLAGTHSKREILTGGMATIFGVHPSGQPYECNWLPPVTLTIDRLRAIWEAWAGQAWKEPKPAREKAEPGQGYTRDDGDDRERVKAAWTPSGVFVHHWPGTELAKDRNGETRILGRGGLLCNDKDGLWHSFADQTGGDVFNAWAYATGRDIDADFPAILREMAAAAGVVLTPRPIRRDGEADSTTRGTAGGGGIVGQINRLRLRLRSMDFSEIVPLELQSATGYRTGDRDRVMADTALGYLWELRTLEARISNLELSVRTGYSPNACGAAMRRLVHIFQPVEPEPGDTSKGATRYKINDALHCDTNNSGEEVSQCSALPLAAYRAHDVFARSLSAITPEQVAEKDAQRLEDGEKPMRRNRQLAARLAAEADALGPAALRLVDALAMYGEMTGVGLAAVLHKSAAAARRVVSRAIDAGLVEEVERGLFDLAEGWAERVGELDSIVPTSGTLARRALAAADSRLRYCDSALQMTRDRAKIEELRRRKERAESDKWEIIKGQVTAYNQRVEAAGFAGVTMAAALRPGNGATFADWLRRKARDEQSGEEAIRGFAQTLAGIDRATAEQMAFYAGYSNFEFAQSWALREIVAIA